MKYVPVMHTDSDGDTFQVAWQEVAETPEEQRLLDIQNYRAQITWAGEDRNGEVARQSEGGHVPSYAELKEEEDRKGPR